VNTAQNLTPSHVLQAAPLYPIVNVADDSDTAVARATALAIALARAGLALVQLRAKTLGAGDYARLARRLIEQLDPLGCRLIVNDRADVARAAGAWGLHVGDEDLPVASARELLGPKCLIGYSTHAIAEVAAACDVPAYEVPACEVPDGCEPRRAADSRLSDNASRGADYLGFGPVFDSPTKAGVRQARGLELLRLACNRSTLPVVAIGGMTVERAAACWQAGATSVAVISELERAFESGRLEELLEQYRNAAAARVPVS